MKSAFYYSDYQCRHTLLTASPLEHPLQDIALVVEIRRYSESDNLEVRLVR